MSTVLVTAPRRAHAKTILDKVKLRWFRQRVLCWHQTSTRHFPWRMTKDPYKVLVAEIMLQQTFARKVVPVYEEFLRRYPTIAELAEADRAGVAALILPLGFQYRAALLVDLARRLRDQYDGRVPEDEVQLRSLPGVGPYIAGAVRSFAFNYRAAIPDTNVIRVLRRFFGLGSFDARPPSSINLTLRKAALELVPKKEGPTFNRAVLDFAALVCTHYRPRCVECPLAQRCVAVQQSHVRGRP